VSTSLPVFYDCFNCPSYCCTYPRIPATKRDIRRLAKHFGIPEKQAVERFTKPGWTGRERVLRHQKDEVFGTACRFLDLETRLCTVHEARPSVCRGHPDGPNCGYYVFLMAERRDQEDPDYTARAYNLPNEFPRLAEEWEKAEAGD
jgi:Fe-S-cluster containining protein